MSEFPGKPTPAMVATEPITPEDTESVREVGICCFCQLPIYDSLDEWDYGSPVNPDTREPAIWHKYCHDFPNEVKK